MKLLKRFNTVLYKMFLSYAVLIVLTTFIIGMTSYLFFTSNFNREVEKLHMGSLNHTSEMMDHNVFRKVESIYMELAMNKEVNFLFDHPIEGNQAKVPEIKKKLEHMATLYPDLVESISVYYENHQAILSSRGGITYLNEVVNNNVANTNWIAMMEQSGSSMLWMGKQYGDEQQNNKSITYARAYPFILKKGNIQGYIAIHTKDNIIYDLIRSSSAEGEVLQFIVDQSGQLISTEDANNVSTFENNKELIDAVTRSSEQSGIFREKNNNIRSVVSYSTLATTGWKLIQITPVEEYYKRSAIIQRTLIIICLIAIMVGIGVSRLFIANLYNPLKKVVHSIRSLFGLSLHPTEKTLNEYILINQAISNLSEKMVKLEATVEDNLPLIKHHLIFGLLHKTISSDVELKEKIKYLQLKMTAPYYRVIVIALDEHQLNGLSIENKQIIIYNLIREIENWNEQRTSCHAISTSDKHIAVILNSDDLAEDAVFHIVQYWFDFASRHFMVQPTAATGSKTTEPMQLHQSYEEAQKYLEYKYFMPEVNWFPDSIYRTRELSREEITDLQFEPLINGLKNNDMEAVRQATISFIEILRHGEYAVEHCHERWRSFVAVYHKYVKDIHLDSKDIIQGHYLERFYEVKNIEQFEQWLLEVIELTFQYMVQRSQNKSMEIVSRAKEYLSNHSSSSLSLSEVAEQVGVSPGYLSQLFKEEVGVNYVDYVTKLRLEKAAEYIIGTQLTIDQISQQVGYNSPTYFIRKFKEAYGVTPKVYRYNHSYE
ncbi:helix-turn-helix domain-containing protein [Paenibacillus sp. GXUN7292]|uniref:helix-turn-helix domain-containing protein n=1 Tax=Paenibacillus sp. GXUN7292 TaxID=3422499 RepID=UPI003D7D0586